MNQYDSVLKTYADAGMRTMADWAGYGRDIIGGSKSHANVTHRGVIYELYTRDQTYIPPKTTIQ